MKLAFKRIAAGSAPRGTRILLLCLLSLAVPAGLRAQEQEADSGLSLAATLSGEALYAQQLSDYPRDSASGDAAFRVILYPSWKINSNWAFNGAVEAYSFPYFFEDFATQNRGVKVDLLQANISYSRFWNRRSLVVRAGQMTSAFGSFLLRYDDATNPLVDVPMSYGYYLKGVTTNGLPGAEVDTTLGKVDLRLQFTNSSPANPRSLFASDQYGTWTWGGGYTIVQGFRVGASVYRGPYLDLQYPYYFSGEAPPSQLPATAVGVDVEWGHGPLNIYGEWQHFQMDYHVIPTFRQQTGYGEARLVLSPRWYVATRLGYTQPVGMPGSQSYEMAVGFRPGSHELMKLDYELQQGVAAVNTYTNTVALQFVASLHPLSIASAGR